jgi:diguanylate cyclase (GGDEF)-like protein
MFGPLPLPPWLKGFTDLVRLAWEITTLEGLQKNYGLDQHGEQLLTPARPDEGRAALERVEMHPALDEPIRTAFSNALRPLREWLAGTGPRLSSAEIDAPTETAASILREAAAEIVRARSDDEKRLAFIASLYIHDLDEPGHSVDISLYGWPQAFGVDATTLKRVAIWAASKGLIQEFDPTDWSVYATLTQVGREWLEEQLGAGPTTSPWWMRGDEPDQKWRLLGSPAIYKRNLAAAVSNATPDNPLSLVFIDFDNLKKLNTDHGNTNADRSLLAVIEVICRAVAGKGRAYLHGHGDEFAVLLPNTTTPEALATAERIRHACERLVLDGLPTPTVTIGVATAPGHASAPEDLERLANGAEQRAKDAGRNRVGVA